MAGVREYFAKHAWSNTELRDLLVELEASSGRDLTQWTQEWLETAGVNTLRPEITTDADGIITAFAILQEAPADHPTLRAQRIKVGLYGWDESKQLSALHTVELDISGARTEVSALVGQPRGELILLNEGDLGYAKLRLDPVSLATAIAHLASVKDSLSRALLWGAVWDATRDGEMPARDYLQLVLNNIGQESDSTVIRVQLAQLRLALARYVSKDAAAQAKADAAEALWTLAAQAAAGSDSQFQLVSSFSMLAITPEQLDRVAQLRSGELALEGLAIDADLGWELLTSLVVGGVAGESEIAAALAQDPSANGELAAAQARAAIPTADAKAKAWSSIIDTEELSNTFQRKAIAGFNRVHDAALLTPYVGPYFESIRGIWETRSYEMAQAIVNGLYPTRPTSEEPLQLTDVALAGLGEDVAALRRLLSEGRDGMARALRAQSADANK